ncbi:hypothetical protein ACQP00_40875 [Dactylosporangium sp. CS-047395]|uniref:hypothetical protein n=1 Tax=Dactylosporangium sp. CS-047395 TaxID=3239936 RepID=UPI003D8D2462
MTAVLRLRPLSVVEEGDEVLIGDPERGTFVAVPPVGGVVVRALLDGATLDEAAARAAEFAGEPVDLADFVTALTDLGFVDTEHAAAVLPATAPVQQRGWTGGPPPALVRPLFSTAAWCGYAAAAVFAVACFLLRPDLWPRPGDVLSTTGELGTSLLILLPIGYALVALHEVWHWLAARSLGLRSRFGVDRRLFFLVFETDLSQLWSVPRRQRYGPQLAGLAVDGVVLAMLLGVQLAAGPVIPVPAMVYAVVAGILWQCMVFLRTDLYGVLVTATGCHDLWRVSSLLLRRAAGRLDAAQRAELAAAAPRDVRVGSWFRWVRLVGYPLAGAYLALYYGPLLVDVGRWAWAGFASGAGSLRFWWGLLVALLAYAPVAAAAWFGLSALRRRPTA